MERILKIFAWVITAVRAWMEFGIMLFVITFAIPIGILCMIGLSALPFVFLNWMISARGWTLLYLIFVVIVAAVVVILRFYGDPLRVQRGREIKTEENAIRKSFGSINSVSRIRRSRR
jgi:membrane protein implicated in regulation of membrane protease activity